MQTLLESPHFKHGKRGNDMNWACSKRSNNSLCHMGCLCGTLTHCLRNPSCGLRRGHAIRCYRVYEVQARFRRLTVWTTSQRYIISFCFEESISGNKTVLFRSSCSSCSSIITIYTYLYSTNWKNPLFMMIAHLLSVANAKIMLNASLQLTIGLLTTSNGVLQARRMSDSPMSWSFSRRKRGIKSLAKPLASHMAQRLLPILYYPWFGSYEMDWNGSIRQSIYNWHQFFLLPMPKDYDGLCQH